MNAGKQQSATEQPLVEQQQEEAQKSQGSNPQELAVERSTIQEDRQGAKGSDHVNPQEDAEEQHINADPIDQSVIQGSTYSNMPPNQYLLPPSMMYPLHTDIIDYGTMPIKYLPTEHNSSNMLRRMTLRVFNMSRSWYGLEGNRHQVGHYRIGYSYEGTRPIHEIMTHINSNLQPAQFHQNNEVPYCIRPN